MAKQVDGDDRRPIALALTDAGQVLMKELLQIASDDQARPDDLIAPHEEVLNQALDAIL